VSLSSNEIGILEIMFLSSKIMEDTQIAIENNTEPHTTEKYLAKLTISGYVDSTQKGLYNLTDKGKKVLGIQLNTKESAKNIMAYAPHDKAFNFYAEVDKPLHIHAHSLQDFINKLSKIDLKSIEFHMNKGDFETWFKCLGDQELAKKAAIIRERKNTGEPLRQLFQDTIEQHYQGLIQLTEQTALV
jgi:predicted transcriptional regulator